MTKTETTQVEPEPFVVEDTETGAPVYSVGIRREASGLFSVVRVTTVGERIVEHRVMTRAPQNLNYAQQTYILEMKRLTSRMRNRLPREVREMIGDDE